MVSIDRCNDWEIIRVLVDHGSTMHILLWDAFERLHIDPDDLKAFKGSLGWIFRAQVEVKGNLTLMTTFRVREQTKEV